MKQIILAKFYKLLSEAYSTISQIITLEQENDVDSFQTYIEHSTGVVSFVSKYEEAIYDQIQGLKTRLENITTEFEKPVYGEDSIGELASLADPFFQ